MDDCCADCRHFLRDTESDEDDGVCRRNPPTVIYDQAEDDIVSVFPLAPAHWLCGEFVRPTH